MSAIQQMLLAGGVPVNYTTPTYVGISTPASGSGSAMTVPAISGATSGDVIILMLSGYTTSGNAQFLTPSGYTSILASGLQNNPYMLAYKYATGADSSVSVSGGGAYVRGYKILLRNTAPSADSPFTCTGDQFNQLATPVALNFPELDIPHNNALVFMFMGFLANANTGAASAPTSLALDGETQILYATDNPGSGPYRIISAHRATKLESGIVSGMSTTITGGTSTSGKSYLITLAVKGLPA